MKNYPAQNVNNAKVEKTLPKIMASSWRKPLICFEWRILKDILQCGHTDWAGRQIREVRSNSNSFYMVDNGDLNYECDSGNKCVMHIYEFLYLEICKCTDICKQCLAVEWLQENGEGHLQIAQLTSG